MDNARAFAKSETGNIRRDNQDSHLVDEAKGVFSIADGMGGKSGGKEASRTLVDRIAESAADFHKLASTLNPVTDQEHRDRILGALEARLHAVNRELYEAGDGEMGTTCDVVLLSPDAAFIAHVGDSRVYLVRDAAIFRLTEDHTFAEKIRRTRRKIGLETGADQFVQYEHILTRSIGGDPRVDVDTLFVDLQPGDRFILCSDGVSGPLDDEDLLATSMSCGAGALSDALVESALRNGARDNVTALVVDIPTETEGTFDRARPIDTIRKISFLEQIDLFDGVESHDLLKLLRIVFKREYDDGDVIIREGGLAEQMFMILEGDVSLRVDGEEVARMGPGEHFGEMALFSADERSADAVAEGEVTLLAIASERFRRLVERDDLELGNKLLQNLLKHAARRIRTTTSDMLSLEPG